MSVKSDGFHSETEFFNFHFHTNLSPENPVLYPQ